MRNLALQEVDTTFGVFMKKLRKFYRYQLTYSVDYQKYLQAGEMDVVEFLETFKLKNNHEKARKIINIYKCLEEFWSFDSFEYGDDTYLDTAVKIYTKYQKRITKYMHKQYQKGRLGETGKPHHTPIEAFLEQVARGFVPIPHQKGVIRLKSTIVNIYLPRIFKDSQEAIEFQMKIGIEGYTGISNLN